MYTATPISELVNRDGGDLLGHSVVGTSNASSQSTSSPFMEPMASPSASSEDDELPAFNPVTEDGKKTYIRECLRVLCACM